MARYGTFAYASGTLYGDMPATTNNLWALQIDWQNIGYDGSNESERMIDCSVTRGRGYILNSDGTGFQRVQPGRMTITLENYDGRYDPYNTDSPLYGYILPGKPFKLCVKNGTAGTLYDVMTGYIDDIQPISGRDQVRITGVDRLESLNSILVQHASIVSDARIDDIVEYILIDAGVTTYSVDQISDTVPYWWMDKVTATYAIGEIEDLVMGTFFVSADGTPTFYARKRPGETVVLDLESDDILREITIMQPWETVRNQIELPVKPRVSQSETVLFSITEPIEVSASTSVEIWASYYYNNESVPATSVDVTQPSSDFKAYSDTGGLGSDVTGDFTLTLTVFPESVKMVIANGGALTGYVTVLNVKGNPLTAPNPMIIRDEDSASVSAYGTRKLTINSKWQQITNDAIDRGDILLTIFADPHKDAVIYMQGRNDIQFVLDLFDRISLTVENLDIDKAYRIGAISTEWLNDNGQDVLTTLKLEEIIDTSTVGYWVFSTNLGTTSYLG